MSLKFNIKSSEVLKNVKEKVKKKLEEDLKTVVKALGKGARQKAEQLAQQKLPGSLNEIYQDNLYMEEISENMVAVGIRQPASWIENGRKGGFMEELLKNAKTSKDGNRYKVIPMKQKTSSSAPKGMASGDTLVGELKTFLRSQGVPHSKNRSLALDKNGSPRIGRIHSFDIQGMRGKKKSAQKLSPNLQNISVFQNVNAKTGKVERNVMSFRVISDKSKSQGKWNHPGRPGEKILQETYQWIQENWRQKVLPELRKKYGSK
jgi:hypothetical protein